MQTYYGRSPCSEPDAENTECLAECRSKMLEGFARVMCETLTRYGFHVQAHDAIEFIEILDDNITDNLLHREDWGGISDVETETREARAKRLWGQMLEARK